MRMKKIVSMAWFATVALAALLPLRARGSASLPCTVRQNWPWDAKVFIDVTMPAGTNDLQVMASFNNNGAHHEIELTSGNGLSSSPYCLTGGTCRLTWNPAADGYTGAITDLNISTTTFTANERAWLVIDLATGAHEFVALGDEPKDANGKPWQDNQYKLSKMVFRRIPAGTFTRGYTTDEKNYIKGLERGGTSRMLTAAEVTLTSDYYITIYQATKGQVARLVGNSTYFNTMTPEAGSVCASGATCFQRGSNSVEGINWPVTKFAVTPNSIIGRFRTLCSNKFWIDLPTSAQWQRAARPDTQWLFYDTSSYPGGLSGGKVGDSFDTITNIIAHISNGYTNYETQKNLYNPPGTPGLYLPNSYGLYDLIGSRREFLLDNWDGNENATASAGIDPVGLQQSTTRMVHNSFSNFGTISNWSLAYADTMNSDREHNSDFEYCYRYVIHLQPPQSFGGKWVNEE